MKNRELILSVLQDRLMGKDKTEGTVMVLSGPWGCGKTYLWVHDLLPKLSGYKTVTISLFGLESIATLKTQLMNQCLLQRAKSLGKGKVKEAMTDGTRLLLEGFKMAIKGVDSFFRTNLLSRNFDSMQLVEENLVVCFDDLERISAKLGLDEILGLANLLAERKNCKVLLITNEEALLKNSSNAETMKKYKERVVDYSLQVDADLESTFRLFLNRYSDKVKTHAYLADNQPFILQAMLASNHANLRTLKKCLQIIAEITWHEEITLDPKLIPSIVALQIEEAEGNLRDPDFYNFNEMAQFTLSGLLKEKQGSRKQPNERLNFHGKYFGNSEGYQFVRAIYNSIKYGYFDWFALKKEINPEALPKESLNSVLLAPQSREWWYLSDSKYKEWIKQIEQHLFSDTPITTAQLVSALVYLKHASDKAGVPLKPKTDSRIRERLDHNALSGDESFNEPNRRFHSEQENIWGPYLEGYYEKALNAIVKSQVATVLAAIEGGNSESFLNSIRQNRAGILAAVSEESLDALGRTFLKNRLFFNDAVSRLVGQLNSYRGSELIENVEEKLSRIRALITKLLDKPNLDNSDQQRLRSLLKQIPPTGDKNE
jgi:hypothetical protein